MINEPPKRFLSIIAGANLFSTSIGLPIIYSLLIFFEITIPGGDEAFLNLTEFWRLVLGVTFQAPWLISYESEFYRMIPTACTFLFIPFYFMFFWVEGIIVNRCLKNSYQSTEVRKAVRVEFLTAWG